MTPLRVQKTAQMPLVQFTEKLVEVTMIMRTSSGSSSTVPAVRRSGGYSNGADDSDTGRCRATGRVQKAIETTLVQFKEMNQQYCNGCRTSRRSRRLLRSYTLWDRDRCRTSRKLTRYRRRRSCRGDARQTVVQIQWPTPRRSRLGCSSAVQYENEAADVPVVKGRRARFRRAGCSNVVAGYGSGG